MDRKSAIVEILQNCAHYALKLFSNFGTDTNELKQLILWIGALTGYLLGTDNYELSIILVIMVVLDWITGIRAAYKTGEKIKSSGLGRTSEKLIGYFALIIVAKLFGNVTQMAGLQKLVTAFYVAKETYSIVENAKKMGIPIPALFEKAIEGKLKEDDEINK